MVIHVPPVQNRLVHFAAHKLSETLQTEVKIGHADFTLFNRFVLRDVLVLDEKKDTLLYAGDIKAKITDWFFLKDEITLHYLGINEAMVQTSRMDSNWNYGFILDALSTPSSTKTKQQNSLQLDIKELDLSSIIITTKDGWKGEDQIINIKNMRLTAHQVDLAQKKILIDAVKIEKPLFQLRQYKGSRPDSLKPKTIPRIEGELYWNPTQWMISAKLIQIENGVFQSDLETERVPYSYFDGAHLQISNLNGTLKDIRLINDTITAALDVGCKERSGLQVNSLRANLKMDPTQMSFSGMDIETPFSNLGGNFSMGYSSFSDDMAKFITQVRLEGNLINSKIDFKDIAFFAPELKNEKIQVEVNGRISGTVSDLKTENLKIGYGNRTSFKGDLQISGLPDVGTTRYNLSNTVLISSPADIKRLMPTLEESIGIKLDPLGRIVYKGGIQSVNNNIRIRGTVTTDQGTATTQISIKDAGGKNNQLKAIGQINHFQLGKLFGQEKLGNTTGTYEIAAKNNNISFITSISGLEYNGYTYSNIHAEGSFVDKILNTSLDIDDNNLKAALLGSVDMAGKEPFTEVDLRVFSSNMKELGLTNLPIGFSGKSSVKFEGSQIDSIIGSTTFTDIILSRGGKNYVFDSIRVVAENIGTYRSFSVIGRDIDARLRGNFDFTEMGTTFNQYFSTYYPLYFKKAGPLKREQELQFRFELKNASTIQKVLDLGITGLNYSIIEGSINTQTHLFKFNASVPKLVYNKVSIYDFQFEANGDEDSLIMSSKTSSIVFNDSLFFPNNEISIRSSKDVSTLNINTFSDRSLYGAQLSAIINNLKDGIRVSFNKSSLVFNEKTWNIAERGEVVISTSLFDARNFKISNGEQDISIITLPPEANRQQTIILSLKEVNLGDILPFVIKEPRIQGITTGDLTLEDPFNELKLYFNAQTDKTLFENDSIGITTMNAYWDSRQKRASFFFESDNPNYLLNVKGKLDLKDSTEGKIDTEIDVNNVSLSLLEPYLGIVFSKMEGFAQGKLQIVGNLAQPALIGELNINKAKVKVDYTQCAYGLEEATIKFRQGVIDLGTITMKDTLGNQAQLKGSLEHQFFTNFRYNINASSRKLIVLNTSKLDNDLFFGRAVARFNFSISGPEAEMAMKVSGSPVDSSIIHINTNSSSKQQEDVEFISWKNYGEEMKSEQTTYNTNLVIDLDLTANSLLKMNIILDEVTGDIISGVGSGNIKIHTGTQEPLSMLGRYNIESGSYNFNFQDIFKKPFKLMGGGSSYISWTGDPVNAEININALYLAEKVRMSTLFNDAGNSSVSGVSSEVLREISDVEVRCNLTGTLNKPSPGFQIVIPQNSAARNNTTIDSKLKTINRDPLEVSKQATYLIVFKSFAPQSAVVANDLNSQLINSTISGVINGILSSSVQNLFSKVLGSSVDVNFNYSRTMTNIAGSTTNSSSSNTRDNVSLQFIKSLMNDKLIITFGSDFNFNTTGSNAMTSAGQSFLFLPDVNVEYKITPDGKFRTSFFYRSNFDVLSSSGKRDRTGGNISFRTEFDRLFERKKHP